MPLKNDKLPELTERFAESGDCQGSTMFGPINQLRVHSQIQSVILHTFTPA